MIKISTIKFSLSPRVSLDGLDMLLEKTLADLGNMELVENTIVAKFHIMGNIGKKNDMENIMKSVEVTVGCKINKIS